MTAGTALVLAGWLAGWWLLARLPRPSAPPRGDVSTLAEMSVVIPARNEAHNLVRLLATIPAGPQVLVVDDHSSDSTAAVAEGAGARVVPAPPLPPGWTGKSWACATGVSETDRPVLMFLDADTWFEPGGFERIAAEHRPQGSLLSVQPYHHTERAYETLSAPFNLVGMMGINAFTPRRRPPTGAFGPCLVCRRDDYERAGGHASVRADILDDVALSRRFTSVRCMAGRGSIRFRMYPLGPAQLLEGWTKNIAAGAGSTRLTVAALTFLWVSGGLSAVTVPAAFAAFVLQWAVHLRRVGRFPWWAPVVYPALLAAFVAVFARSLALTVVRRRVRWKGREIAIPRGPH